MSHRSNMGLCVFESVCLITIAAPTICWLKALWAKLIAWRRYLMNKIHTIYIFLFRIDVISTCLSHKVVSRNSMNFDDKFNALSGYYFSSFRKLTNSTQYRWKSLLWHMKKSKPYHVTENTAKLMPNECETFLIAKTSNSNSSISLVHVKCDPAMTLSKQREVFWLLRVHKVAWAHLKPSHKDNNHRFNSRNWNKRIYITCLIRKTVVNCCGKTETHICSFS